jgi:hypothetical protein
MRQGQWEPLGVSNLYDYAVEPCEQTIQKQDLSYNFGDNQFSLKRRIMFNLKTGYVIKLASRDSSFEAVRFYFIFSSILRVFLGFFIALKTL